MPGPMGSGGLVVDVESDSKAVATRAGARRPVGSYIGDPVEGARSSQQHDAEYKPHLINIKQHITRGLPQVQVTAERDHPALEDTFLDNSTVGITSRRSIQDRDPPGHDDASIRQPRDSNIESLWHEIERIQGMLPSRDEFDLYVSEASPNLRRDIKKEARSAKAEATEGACMSAGARAFLDRFAKHRRQQQQQ